MPGIGFRVKLYGHMGRDDVAFATKLAGVLAVEESAAQLWLQSVPSVVKEGLEEAQAISLCQRLTSIGALCLTEPIENYSLPYPTAADQVDWAPREDASQAPKAAERPFLVPWGTLLACAFGLGVVLVVFSLWSSYTRISETLGPVPHVSEPEKPDALPEAQPSQPAMSLQQLYDEIDAAERNLEHLRFVVDLREREMQAVAGAYRVDRNVVRERRALWEKARAEIDAELKKLKELQAALIKLESVPAP